MHESQSRLCENYLGKTLAFWEYHYPRLQEVFPKQLGKVALEDFYKAINASKPSFVRTEADELTYPLHILIRYEIERGSLTAVFQQKDLIRHGMPSIKNILE